VPCCGELALWSTSRIVDGRFRSRLFCWLTSAARRYDSARSRIVRIGVTLGLAILWPRT
jgi:hypothetical protein